MVTQKYTPRRGDIVWLDFSPTKGHEQSGRRPALVLSQEAYNKFSELAVVVPITTKSKGYNFEVPISLGKGNDAVLSDQICAVVYKERDIQYISQASSSVIEHVVAKVHSLIG